MGLTVRRAGALPWPVKEGAAGADYRLMRIPRPGRFELVAAAFLAVTVVFAIQTAHGWTGDDFGIYGRAGRTLLSASSLHAYHSPLIQAGPLELALDGALWHMHDWPVTLAIVSDLLIALLLVGAVLMFVGRRTLALAVVCGGALALVMPGHPFGWSLRLLQALVTLAIVVPLARRVRGLGAAIFIVPAATAIVRLAIDPMGTYYYWDTPLAIELVGAAAAVASFDSIQAWAGNRLGRRVAPSA
jgi:hypothetical protein